MMMAAAAIAAMAGAASAQERPVEPAPAAPRLTLRQLIPIEVQVVVAKFQGEKRVSSVPYVLALNAVFQGTIGNNTERAQLTIGSEVPVPTTTFPAQTDGKSTQPLRSFNYRNVGTVISAAAVTSDNAQFEIELQIDESSLGTSVTDGRAGSPPEMPVFKNFKARNRILLRPGVMRQFTAATDRISGETVKIEVTLAVVK